MQRDIKFVFDVGRVLIEWRPDAALRAAGYSEAAVQFFAQTVVEADPWHRFDRGQLDEAGLAELAATKGPFSVAEVASMQAVVKAALKPIPAMVELAQSLKQSGAALYILSNMSSCYRAYLRQFEFFDQFDCYWSYESQLLKPEAAIYTDFMQRYELDGESLFFIDDRAENVAAAQAFGWQTFQFEGVAQLPALKGAIQRLCQ